MMGRRAIEQALFYHFPLDDQVPKDHLLRRIDGFVRLFGYPRRLTPFYSEIGRPSVDPELLIRMLIVGYCFGLRSERRLRRKSSCIWHIAGSAGSTCDTVPHHSTFSENRLHRFRDSDVLRHIFETVVAACIRPDWSGAKALRSMPA